jgi:hypothetical protein
MDILEFFAIMVPVLMVGILAMRWIALADARARIELQKRLQKSKERTSAQQRERIQPQDDESAELGPWVGPLLEEFGVDPDTLFEEEMPAELKTLLPLAKGFIKSGGLQKLLANGQQTPPDKQSI